MPTTVCPICGYANVYSFEECINCGIPLLRDAISGQYTVSEENKISAGNVTKLNNRQEQEYEEGDIPSPEPLDRQVARPVGNLPARRQLQSRPYLQGEREERAVIRYRKPALATRYRDGDPYESNMDMQPYQPQQALLQTLVTEEHKQIDPEPWKTDRLPWTLPRRRPQLSGKIIHIRNEMEFPDFPNVLRAIIDLMSEFLWMAANQPTHKEGERVQITIVRLRTSDGQLRDARLMGYMRGANLSLGDIVSFWGWRRRGSLMVKKGYNHTSKATIVTNVMSMLVPGLIVLALVLALFVFAFYRSDIFAFFQSLWR